MPIVFFCIISCISKYSVIQSLSSYTYLINQFKQIEQFKHGDNFSDRDKVNYYGKTSRV